MPVAPHVLLSIMVIMSPAHHVLPIVCTDYTYDSEHGIAEGVLLGFRRSISFPLETMVTYATWDVFFSNSDELLECMKYTCRPIGNSLCDFTPYIVNK